MTSQIDVSRIGPGSLQPNSSCGGYVVERPTSAAQILRVLMGAFFFDACESDGVIKFVPRYTAGAFPPVPVGPGQNVVYLTPQANTNNGGGNEGTSSSFNGGGTAFFHQSLFGGTPPSFGTSVFTLPGIVSPANIVAVYLVGNASHGPGTENAVAFATVYDSSPGNPAGKSWISTSDYFASFPLMYRVAGQAGDPYPNPAVFPFSAISLSANLQASIGGIYDDTFSATFSLAVVYTGAQGAGDSTYVPGLFTIPENDLGLRSDKCKLVESQGQARDLPQNVTVLYNDPAIDYQQGKQERTRSVRVVNTRQRELVSIPLTLTGDQAIQIAEVALWLAWLERDSYLINLWRAIYLILDPTDVVQFTYEGLAFRERITSNTMGAGFVTNLEGVSQDINNFLSKAIGGVSSGFTPAGMRLAANSLLFLLDIPLLIDTDSNPGGTGYYVGMSSQVGDWGGAILYDSSDDTSWTDEASSNQPVAFGTATTALGSPRSPWSWDNINTLTISMQVGTLAGDTMLNVLNGSNKLVVASGAGWEIIQFTTAVQNMDGTFTISGLLRGRRGTEGTCAGHAIGDLVFAPATGMLREDLPLSVVSLLRYYQAVSIGQALGTGTVKPFTIAGLDLYPYAPVDVAGSRDMSGNLTVTWVRRTRIGGEWLDGIGTVPVSEDSEAYEADIYNGGALVRTITAFNPMINYSAAQQTTDFGAPQSAILMRIYQVSAQVGKGFPRVAVA